MESQSVERDKLLKEAEYKERLADDLDRAGAWQAPFHREKAKELREEAERRYGSRDRRKRTDEGRLDDAPERTKRIT